MRGGRGSRPYGRRAKRCTQDTDESLNLLKLEFRGCNFLLEDSLLDRVVYDLIFPEESECGPPTVFNQSTRLLALAAGREFRASGSTAGPKFRDSDLRAAISNTKDDDSNRDRDRDGL